MQAVGLAYVSDIGQILQILFFFLKKGNQNPRNDTSSEATWDISAEHFLSHYRVVLTPVPKVHRGTHSSTIVERVQDARPVWFLHCTNSVSPLKPKCSPLLSLSCPPTKPTWPNSKDILPFEPHLMCQSKFKCMKLKNIKLWGKSKVPIFQTTLNFF